MLPGDATLLQISAHGESHRTPDVATISAGVVTQDKDAKVAMSDNANRMNAVIAALKRAGVADRDLQTSSISLNPQYNYNSGSSNNEPPTITSYQASNTVNVRLRDIGKVGDVLDALVKQGANQINGPTFNVDKPDAAMDEARTDAVKQAQARAALYASATGIKVRRIVSISESGEAAAPQPRMMLARANKASGTPIAAGESTLAVDLNVVFELGR
ncbi:MAG: SIMPL domain-containing protein [Lysobacteraceae bacterium]